MALTKDDIHLAAERLDRAEKTRKQIRQLSLDHPGITIADAYAIQKAWIDIKVAGGRVVKGHKIGLTSKAMQSALGIDEPDSGILLDDMFFADGGLVPSDRFIGTRVEAELAFIMKQRLAGPHCTMFDVLNATDFVVPALEILDTRIERVDPQTKSTRKIFDTIADNAANAGIVLGGRPLRPLEADLRWIGASQRSIGRNRACGRRAQSSRHQRGLARQQDRAARTCARARPGGAGGIVYSPDRDAKGRHDSSRLWPVWYAQLLLRLTPTTLKNDWE
jgi:2-oxo-hept-3-ene-1,7-dioate hydratase